MPDATHSQHLDGCSFPDGPKRQTVTPLKSRKTEVNETLFTASVPMKQEADTRVLPAHFENGGDKSDTRWFPTPRRTALMTLSQRGRSCSKTSAGLSGYTKTCTAEFCGHARRLPAGLQAHDHPKGSGQDSQHCPQTRGIHPNSNRRGLRWQPSPAQPASRGHYGAEGRCDAIRAREAAPVCPVTIPR